MRGLDPHAQRWIPILFSLLTLLPLWSIACAGGLGPLARVTVCGVFLFAPYQVQYGAELRSYSAVQLVSVLLVWAAVTSRAAAGVRLAVFGLATAIGLYLHYGVAVAVLSIGFARCVVRPAGSVSLPAMIAVGTLGVLSFLPWLVSAESWLFTFWLTIVRWIHWKMAIAIPIPAMTMMMKPTVLPWPMRSKKPGTATSRLRICPREGSTEKPTIPELAPSRSVMVPVF